MRHLLLACALLVAACTSAPDVRSVALAELDEDRGAFEYFTGPTACRSRSNIRPWVRRVETTTPRVDRWFALYGTRGTTPDPKAAPPLFVWLVGHSKLSPAFNTPAAPGCWLLVRPALTLICWERALDAAPPSPDQRVVAWQEHGRAMLLLRPRRELAGRKLHVQLAMQAEGENFAGVLISQGVTLTVGR